MTCWDENSYPHHFGYSFISQAIWETVLSIDTFHLKITMHSFGRQDDITLFLERKNWDNLYREHMPEATPLLFHFKQTQANPNKETESKSWKKNNMQKQIVKNSPKQREENLGTLIVQKGLAVL